MAKTIIIGCRLPNGIVLHHPLKPNVKVTLKGLNASLIKGATYFPNEVDAEFWETWKLSNGDKQHEFAPLKSQAIFEASGARDADDKAKDLSSVKTGLEPLGKEAMDAAKVKPADKD